MRTNCVTRATWFAALALGTAAGAQDEVAPNPAKDTRSDPKESVLLVQVLGALSEDLCDGLETRIEGQLADSGYRNLVLQIDTPGGDLVASAKLARYVHDLRTRKPKVFTIAYVPSQGHAIGAGMLLAFACEAFEMGEGSTVAGVAVGSAAAARKAAERDERTRSVIRDDLLRYAREHGFPEALVEKLVYPDGVVFRVKEKQPSGNIVTRYLEGAKHDANASYVEQVPVSPHGQLLALREGDAKSFGFIHRVIPTFESLKEHHKLYGNVMDTEAYERNPAILTTDSAFVRFLNHTITRFALILIGALFLVLEIKFTGTVLPGLTGLFAFFLYFLGGYLAGTAGWLEISLFLGALALLGTEIFFLPGFGVAGVSGLVLLVASLVMAIHAPGEELSWDSVSRELVVVLGGLAAAFAGTLVVLQWLPGPTSSAGSGLVLSTVLEDGTEGATSDAPGAPARDALLHRRGLALTALRPSGKMSLDGVLLDVVAAGEFIDEGTSVEIIAVEGSRVVVARSAETRA